MKIMITGIPPGEAPLNIRKQWVGLVLETRGRAVLAVQGILTGKLTNEDCEGYLVPVDATLLKLPSEAASWWRQNCPYMIGRTFVFDASVCAELERPNQDNQAWG